MLWGLWGCLILTVDHSNSGAGGYIWLLAWCLSPAPWAPLGTGTTVPWDQLSSDAAIQGEGLKKNLFLPGNKY